MTKKIIKIITSILYAALIFAVLLNARKFSIDALLSYTPSNVFLAIIFLLGIYAVKSISVFLPIIVLQIVSGFLFPAPLALLVNITGAVIDFTLPYYLGKFTGAGAAEKKIQKHENIRNLFERQHKHQFFLTFFLRVISCLPADLVSMYLGALRFDFKKYLVASMLGTLPGLIPATFMGRSITDPLSPQFIAAALITVVCTVVSILAFHIYNKKQKKNLK